MSRRDNQEGRCPRCFLLLELCLCAELPKLSVRTQLHLVVHYTEARKPTNTGQLAARCLAGSTVHIHGLADAPVLAPPTTGRRVLLLFPSEEAEELASRHAEGEPVSLVVPDGNWRQADKMGRRLPWLRDVPRVFLPEGPATTYQLRTERRPGGLATMEAIARALGILEGPTIEQELQKVFKLFVERTLVARGVR